MDSVSDFLKSPHFKIPHVLLILLINMFHLEGQPHSPKTQSTGKFSCTNSTKMNGSVSWLSTIELHGAYTGRRISRLCSSQQYDPGTFYSSKQILKMRISFLQKSMGQKSDWATSLLSVIAFYVICTYPIYSLANSTYEAWLSKAICIMYINDSICQFTC